MPSPAGISLLARVLLAAYLGIWGLLAIDPVNRFDWLLENLLVFLLGLGLYLGRHRIQLSTFSICCLFIFMVVHAVGAHYTYSLVPYDTWLRVIDWPEFGDGSGAGRNQFDRFAHFLHGLLLTFPVRDVLIRNWSARGRWAYLLPAALIMLLSATYELVEWIAAEIVNEDAGIAFVGAQGDVWDAQKDMSLAFLGAVTAMSAGWLYRRLFESRSRSRASFNSTKSKP
ncbi:MAG: DUF2238 domain-containing protein [Rhodospirillaceae bacterium]|nr:DUF2238 domain-containing protein [Rhodospirillaceae bacterium]